MSKYQSSATPAIRAAYRKVGLRVLPMGELILATDYDNHPTNPVNSGLFEGLSQGSKVNEDGNLILRKIKKKSRKRIVYKVCKKVDNQLISARYGGTIVYNPIGKWTHAPKGTRIFTFETLEAAKTFYLSEDNEVIFEAEVVDGFLGYGKIDCNTEKFWNKFNQYNKSHHPEKAMDKLIKEFSIAQYKSFLVTKVKLLREVK